MRFTVELSKYGPWWAARVSGTIPGPDILLKHRIFDLEMAKSEVSRFFEKKYRDIPLQIEWNVLAGTGTTATL